MHRLRQHDPGVDDRVPLAAAQAIEVVTAIADDRLDVGEQPGAVLPRLNSVSVWPRARAALTMCGPTKPVPPRTRMRLGLAEARVAYASSLEMMTSIVEGSIREVAQPAAARGERGEKVTAAYAHARETPNTAKVRS